MLSRSTKYFNKRSFQQIGNYGKMLSSSTSSAFYNVTGYRESEMDTKTVMGEVVDIDASIDLKELRPGDCINAPFELTLNQSFRYIASNV